MSIADPTKREAPDSLMLTGFWYRALPSNQVWRGQLHKAMLLEVPLVIGRDKSGRPFALRDACPHRGMPLSRGRFDGEQLECSYHGWRFDAQGGQCQLIPSLTADQNLKVDRIYAGNYACEESDDFVWVFIPDPGPASAGFTRREEPEAAVPRVPTLSDKFRTAYLSADLPCSVDHGIIGLMDPAHGPFVHQAWWWRSRHSIHEKEKVFEPIPNGFRIAPHAPSANSSFYKLLGVYGQPITTTIQFVLPNMRFEEIHCGPYWFSSRTTVTPITRERCRIDFCAAWNVFRWAPWMVPIFRVFARMFLRQDQRTMEIQAEGLKHNPSLMLIDDADRPAKWYFQLKSAYLESKRSGKPMVHPIPGPVTLRWRS